MVRTARYQQPRDALPTPPHRRPRRNLVHRDDQRPTLGPTTHLARPPTTTQTQHPPPPPQPSPPTTPRPPPTTRRRRRPCSLSVLPSLRAGGAAAGRTTSGSLRTSPRRGRTAHSRRAEDG